MSLQRKTRTLCARLSHGCALSKVLVARGQERTRREIAAYVAEGPISPQDAVAMLNAGRSKPTSADSNA